MQHPNCHKEQTRLVLLANIARIATRILHLETIRDLLSPYIVPGLQGDLQLPYASHFHASGSLNASALHCYAFARLHVGVKLSGQQHQQVACQTLSSYLQEMPRCILTKAPDTHSHSAHNSSCSRQEGCGHIGRSSARNTLQTGC